MWRLTKALNYVVHHAYYSMVFQAWFLTEKDLDEWLAENEETIDNQLREKVAEEVGYPPEEWWFPDEPSIEKEEVAFRRKLIGKTEWRHEKVRERSHAEYMREYRAKKRGS